MYNNKKDTNNKETRYQTWNNLLTSLVTAYKEQSKEYPEILLDTARACTLSVIKKCLDVKPDDNALQRAKLEIIKNSDNYIKFKNLIDIEYIYKLNENGDIVKAIRDSDERDAAYTLIGSDWSGCGGLDLVNDAVVALLECLQKTDNLQDTVTSRELERKVIINNQEPTFKEVQITYIQQVYRAVRQSIRENKSVCSASNKYIYLDDIIEDEDGNEYNAYIRLPKYSDVGVITADGNNPVIVGEQYSYEYIYNKINSMHLSTSERTVLEYRLSGYSYGDIAKKMGLSNNTVKGYRQRICKKALDSGLFPNK